MWVHQICEPDRTFTGEFICKLCKKSSERIHYNEIQSETVKYNFFDNGLIKDHAYYKHFPNGRGYIVSILDGFHKKLPLADFLTLNGTHWLSDAVIDFILNMINTKGVYQIIDAGLHAQFIFNEPEHSFLKNFKIVKEHLYIPLLVNGNHWCAIEISISKKEFTYLDPFGEQLSTCSSYLKKFIMYLKKS